MTTVAPGFLVVPAIDTERWPDLRAAASARLALVHTLVARRVFEAVAARLPIRVLGPDGVMSGGSAADPTAPLMVLRRPRDFHARLGTHGLIGFGESYMAGDWDAPDLGALLTVFARDMANLVPAPLQRLRDLYVAQHPRSERNSEDNTRSNIARHYDLSNDLFAAFLDETMTYSSALFDAGTPTPRWEDLAGAQRRKIDRLLDATGVREGSRVLEIGTGWGELALRAAARGATVRTITLSQDQLAVARARIDAAGHGDRVSVELMDYRGVAGTYDAVVSVEMVEAVGADYWGEWFATIDRVLAPGGVVGIQAITMAHERMVATRDTYTWVHKYIFPGGIIPSVRALTVEASRHTALRVVDQLSFGKDYAQTLRLWDERFVANAVAVAGLGFDDVFRRMWHFYLEYSRAGFASGYLDVQHLVLRREPGA